MGENDLLDYVEGAGILTYKQMNELKKEKHLTINGVNGFHSELRRYIDNIERGVSTKFLDNWCSFISYVHNYKIDNGHTPSSLDEVESIVIDICSFVCLKIILFLTKFMIREGLENVYITA